MIRSEVCFCCTKFEISCRLCKKKNVKEIVEYASAAAKSLQSYPTLCDPIDGSPPGSSIHGIFQATVLEWGAIVFSDS